MPCPLGEPVASALELGAQAVQAVHATVQSGQQSGNFKTAVQLQAVKRPGTVFAAAPCEPGFGTRI